MSASRLSNLAVTVSAETEKQIDSALVYIVNTIIDKPEKHKEIATKLANFPYKALVRICQKDNFVEKFCRTNPDFLALIKEKLSPTNYPDIGMESIDGKENYHLFDIYLAASFMSHFMTAGRGDRDRVPSLNAACDLGLYNALSIRCIINEKTVKNMSLKEDDREQAVKEIMADTKRLINLYWGAGYVQAGCILHSLANHFLAKEDENEINRGQSMREDAIKNFLCAALLQNNDTSNAQIQSVTKGQGLMALFEGGNVHFSDWTEAKVICQEWAKDSYPILEKCAQEEINSVLLRLGLINYIEPDKVESAAIFLELFNHAMNEIQSHKTSTPAEKREAVRCLLAGSELLKEAVKINDSHLTEDTYYPRYFEVAGLFKSGKIQDAAAVKLFGTNLIGTEAFDQEYEEIKKQSPG